MPKSWNLFSIGRRVGEEDQLTEMLVWLASAVPAVRAGLIEFGLGLRIDPDAIAVTTQYAIAGVGRLDALLQGEDFMLIVESKLGSGYGPDQIGRYLRWLSGHDLSSDRAGLMTLTATTAPWPEPDIRYAGEAHIRGSARLWEELHAVFQPLVQSAEDGMSARMVQEFLDLLSDENLVPTPPLSAAELSTTWADAWQVVRRYREFFHACKETIGGALGAEIIPNSWSDRGDWYFQDYVLVDGTRVVMGLLCTDENEKTPQRKREPIIWAGAKVDHLKNLEVVRQVLESGRPEGWRKGNAWWGRPTIWRPLGEVVSDGTFDEQRASLARASGDVREWVAEGLRAGE